MGKGVLPEVHSRGLHLTCDFLAAHQGSGLARPAATTGPEGRLAGSPEPLVCIKEERLFQEMSFFSFKSLSLTIQIVQATGQELLNWGPVSEIKGR